MEKRKFIREPGVVYDLQFLYTLFFNRSYCFANFAVEDTDDKDFFMSLILENKDISKSFLPFFKRVNDRGIFFSKYYFDRYEKEIFNGFGVSDICKLVLDVDSFASNLLAHYFPAESSETLEKCRNSLPDLCRLVHASDYDDALKSELINFFVDPNEVVFRFSRDLSERYEWVKNQHRSVYESIVSVQDTFDLERLNKDIELGRIRLNIDVDLGSFSSISISVCALYRGCATVCMGEGSELLLLLGVQYDKYLEYLDEKGAEPFIHYFSTAFSDDTRIRILNVAKQRGEITVKDIEALFGFTGTNAYYHLNIMHKCGVFTIRTLGKTVYYRINPEFFENTAYSMKRFMADKKVV